MKIKRKKNHDQVMIGHDQVMIRLWSGHDRVMMQKLIMIIIWSYHDIYWNFNYKYNYYKLIPKAWNPKPVTQHRNPKPDTKTDGCRFWVSGFGFRKICISLVNLSNIWFFLWRKILKSYKFLKIVLNHS